MTRTVAARPLALAALLALGGAVVAQAEPPTESPRPRLLALQIGTLDSRKSEDAVSEEVQPRIVRYLVPRLQELGYVVETVHDAHEASLTGTHDLAIKLEIDARDLYLVHEAERYDRAVRVDQEKGVEAWARWTLWSEDQKRRVVRDRLGPVRSGVHQAGAGRPVIDDMEAVARVFADTAMDVIGPWETYVRETPADQRLKAKKGR